ncbi:Opr family porin [Chrysiogenes arsenatis]|uniref:Opr family porin n=1 Tax=Chrysiogenes arsenatis TaxID=309797 RepID=UPI0003F65468|nr:Opr family porin [Chrysiogenes arsenatis]
MNRVHHSLFVAAALCAIPAMASANALEESFKNGSVSGHVGIYGQQTNYDDAATPDEGFSNGNASISYETAPLHGLSLGMGAWATTRLSEKNDGNYDALIAQDAIIHEAFIRYTREGVVGITAGRHAADLEWLGDYIEGATATVDAIENLGLTFVWAKRQAVVGVDEVSDKFSLLSDNDALTGAGLNKETSGLFVFDAKYTPITWLEINPYYYHAPDAFRAPGLKLTATFEPMEGLTATTMGQYVRSSVDSNLGGQDGNVAWIEQGVAFNIFSATAGYISVDDKGAGFIASFGDQTPFAEGNNTLSDDARTFYLGAGVEIAGVSLGALYGQTRYFDGIDKTKEKELDLSVGYEIIPNLTFGISYADVKNDKSGNDNYNIVSAGIEYGF